MVPLCPSKSNGMTVQPSLASPAAAPFLMRSLPLASGPFGVVPMVTYVTMPGLLVLTIFSALTTRCRTVAFENSVSSMSMSSAFRWYALITFWYAPASAEALEHFSPSLLPLQPPTETTTSPPAARMDLIALSSEPPVSAREPSHFGLQPPSDRMKASVNHLTPVAAMTSVGLGVAPAEVLVRGDGHGARSGSRLRGIRRAGLGDCGDQRQEQTAGAGEGRGETAWGYGSVHGGSFHGAYGGPEVLGLSCGGGALGTTADHCELRGQRSHCESSESRRGTATPLGKLPNHHCIAVPGAPGVNDSRGTKSLSLYMSWVPEGRPDRG